MIENIEGFHAQIERLGFSKVDGLGQLQIKVFDSWTVEKAAWRVSRLTQPFWLQDAGVKYRLAVARIGMNVNSAGKEFGSIQEIVVDAITQGSQKRAVGIVVEGHRKSASEAAAAGKTPAFRQPALAEELVKGQRVCI